MIPRTLTRMPAPWWLAIALVPVLGCNADEPASVKVPVIAPFVAMARQDPCANQKNRLFLIDRSLVFWDKRGDCADGSYGQFLFGATPQDLLCRNMDSIAGPRRDCPNPAFSPLFDVIIAHPDEPDLGLGPGHTVRPIPF